ncbi:dnaJ homolog subfamily C member 4 isoform X2 [Scyliorhinus torazame]|uniref:dnaJ homolog subfamily C member 4 isoform X2 n=1 Tax=Scyliorhinus torazame TaxID=75743 RepID=UPI003B5BCF69
MLLGAPALAAKHCLWHSVPSRRIATALYRSGAAADYYTILGIKSDATLQQIKQAFLDQSKKLHPDIDLSNPELHSCMVRLNEAYSVLSKARSRREYDTKLELWRRAPPGAASGPPGASSRQADPFFYTAANSSAGFGFEQSAQQRYWEQFRYATADDYAAFHSTKKQRRNMKAFGYCVFAMLAGVFIHYVGFRANGFKKQQEILRQKHAEFVEKYKLRKGGGGGED